MKLWLIKSGFIIILIGLFSLIPFRVLGMLGTNLDEKTLNLNLNYDASYSDNQTPPIVEDKRGEMKLYDFFSYFFILIGIFLLIMGFFV